MSAALYRAIGAVTASLRWKSLAATGGRIRARCWLGVPRSGDAPRPPVRVVAERQGDPRRRLRRCLRGWPLRNPLIRGVAFALDWATSATARHRDGPSRFQMFSEPTRTNCLTEPACTGRREDVVGTETRAYVQRHSLARDASGEFATPVMDHDHVGRVLCVGATHHQEPLSITRDVVPRVVRPVHHRELAVEQ